MVNSALEDFFPIKRDFNYKQEGDKYRKTRFRKRKKKVRWKVKTPSCPGSPDIWAHLWSTPPETKRHGVSPALLTSTSKWQNLPCSFPARESFFRPRQIPQPVKIKLYVLSTTWVIWINQKSEGKGERRRSAPGASIPACLCSQSPTWNWGNQRENWVGTSLTARSNS